VLVVSSLCYRAGLRTATVDGGVARLVVVPRDVAGDGTPACGQCIADASFEVTGRFAGGLPDELVVELRGQEPRTYRTSLRGMPGDTHLRRPITTTQTSPNARHPPRHRRHDRYPDRRL
jgi:hypothetical protein